MELRAVIAFLVVHVLLGSGQDLRVRTRWGGCKSTSARDCIRCRVSANQGAGSGSPAATGFGTATRGCFVKFISVKLFNNQALLYVLLFAFITVVGTTAHAVNNYYVSPSGS